MRTTIHLPIEGDPRVLAPEAVNTDRLQEDASWVAAGAPAWRASDREPFHAVVTSISLICLEPCASRSTMKYSQG